MKTSLLLPDHNGCTQGTLLPRADFWPEAPKLPFRARYVTTADELIDFADQLWDQKWFSFDTETTSINPRRAELVGMSFCWSAEEAWYIPVQCPSDEICVDERAARFLQPILENPAVQKIGQNLKYDAIVLKNHGIKLKGIAFDTLIASYLLDAGSRRHNLDLLAKKYLGYDTIKISSLIGSGKHQLGMQDVPLEVISAYAAEDAWVVAQLAPILWKEAERQNLLKLLEHVEIPLIDVLADMEYNGILLDQVRLAELKKVYEDRIAGKLDDIKSQTCEEFNPASTLQLREQLFEIFGLKSTKQTDSGLACTDHGVLDELGKTHEFPKTVSEYRQLTKLNGTYVSSLPEMIFPETGRIHASFNQAVTATGRLSSSDPNLQNIPNKTEQGKEIRLAFIAPPGHLLVAADYSQIELRILAHYSDDPRLLAAFHGGEDIHAIVASQVANVPLSEVTPTMRKAAKTINFGIIYGQGAQKLAESLGITKDQAKFFIEKYFQTYPAIRKFKQGVIAGCRSRGYVTTILGRRRYIPAINEPDGPDRWSAERQAVNTVVQGSAADLLKIAMLEIYGQISNKQINARMLLQIHDELVFEIPLIALEAICEKLNTIMTSVIPLKVPLLVDIKYGQSWAGMVPYGREPITNNQSL